ncbi:MAG: hypothetical protein II916_07610 [Oscillospiraceae bacterium]|nr:hypothetical protein [Oscillospiraceae bacterium]
MNIPEESYLTGIWEVDEADEYHAKELVRDYHANRTVCRARQRKLLAYRFCFLVMLMPLFFYFVDEFFQKDLANYMAVISLVYTLFSLYFVLFPKNLRIPALGSLIYLAEVFRLRDWTLVLPNWIPIIILNALAHFYDKDRKWLSEQAGFPEFHDITVRVKKADPFTERSIPPAAEPAEDPYKDILSSLQ